MARESTPLLAGQNKAQPVATEGKTKRPVLLQACAVLLAFFFCLLGIRVLGSWVNKAKVPSEVEHDFGVGFQLTYPYGTAAISFPNGTIVEVANIDGSSAYGDTMRRLSLVSSKHPYYPSGEVGDAFYDQPRKWLRAKLKQLGLPASIDVGRLACLLQQLREAVEDHLGRRIDGAIVTIPQFPALYGEDVRDALEHVGLLDVIPAAWRLSGHASDSGAALVPTGRGLCPNYTDPYACYSDDPDWFKDRHQLLSVAYSRGMVNSIRAWYIRGFHLSGQNIGYNLSIDLGSNSPDRPDNLAAAVEVAVEPLARSSSGIKEEFDVILVHGESALESPFQDLLRARIRELLQRDVEFVVQNPTFAPARGAAEMAKRITWNQKHSVPLDATRIATGGA